MQYGVSVSIVYETRATILGCAVWCFPEVAYKWKLWHFLAVRSAYRL